MHVRKPESLEPRRAREIHGWGQTRQLEGSSAPSKRAPLRERFLCHASPLLLFGEEIDPASGRDFGNFPQGLKHLSLIDAAMHVIPADEQLLRTQSLLDSPGAWRWPRDRVWRLDGGRGACGLSAVS